LTLVSRRTLPSIRLELFAAFLDGLRHGSKIRRINATHEAQEVTARGSGKHREVAGEIQDLPLPRSVQASHLVDDFVFNRLRHNETNLGKDFFDVKGGRVLISSRKLPAGHEEVASGENEK
jgi:hypothetical protein